MISFQYIKTSADGSVTQQTNVAKVIADFRIEEQLGDEQYVRSGDLRLNSPTLISCPQSFPVTKCWIGAYYNSTLIGIYDARAPEMSYDYVNKLYSYRFRSLSGYIYDLFEKSLMQYESDTSAWQSAIQSGAIAVEKTRINSGTGGYVERLDVFGFSIGNIIAGLASKIADHFRFGTVTNQAIPVTNADDLPIVFRGQSDAIGFVTLGQCINNTFYQNPSTAELYKLYWADIVALGLNTFNAFLKVQPEISGGYLKANLVISPKTKKASASPVTKKWEEVRIAYNKFKIDSVVINGANFTFSTGDPNGIKVEKSLPIANPDASIGYDDHQLYWVAGDYKGSTFSGYPYYDILTAGGNNRPYADEGILEPYYSELLTNGNGIEGVLRYNGEQTLDQLLLTTGGATYQINKMTIDQAAKASIEAIEIQP